MIFLTGNSGYIGGHLHQAYPSANTLDESQCFQRWETLFAEVRDSIEQATTIIHCGAIADSLYQDPNIFKWNYEATKQLADMARQKNAFLIFISSCTAIAPESYYGWSKRVAEDYIRVNNEKYCILRLYNVYGDEDNRPPENHSVPEKLMRRTLRYVFCPFRRDYIHVADVVRAVRYVENSNIIGTYDVGTGKAVEVKELAELTDGGFYTETTAAAVLGENHPPLELQARPDYMLPGFKTVRDVYSQFVGT
ncbi:NAD(P)-dependent oxidoreductase [Candidatus Poribacteria bacterium]|nr:NAD(P)-dependent oxidoreductase [Candidatus Poribacteria bacterium]MDE0688530.1 NAD(P)-dependent oxidoreductase [Candidatus Poribacteria bacterium]MYA58113.1 NAD(P)-dependent oxidoreductase [Candidatus Poribacteria bacterium]